MFGPLLVRLHVGWLSVDFGMLIGQLVLQSVLLILFVSELLVMWGVLQWKSILAMLVGGNVGLQVGFRLFQDVMLVDVGREGLQRRLTFHGRIYLIIIIFHGPFGISLCVSPPADGSFRELSHPTLPGS